MDDPPWTWCECGEERRAVAHKDLLVLNRDQKLMSATGRGPVEIRDRGVKGELAVMTSAYKSSIILRIMKCRAEVMSQKMYP